MKALDALNILSGITAYQRGLFTTAQAESAGVGRLELSRLASHGQLERVMCGVYRAAAAPSLREERVLAAWMALDPAVPTWQRACNEFDAVVSHATAAWLMELGELNPEPLTFTSQRRRQTSRAGLRLVKAPLEARDVTIVCGMPTTTPERTVIDLLQDNEDESLVSNVLKDAIAADPTLATGDLPAKVDALAKRLGHPAGYPLFELMAGGR